MTDPQDVAAAGPGAFYVSNGTGGSVCAVVAGYGVLPGSNILYFNGMSFRVAVDDLYGARGLMLTPDGGHLLVGQPRPAAASSRCAREPFSGNLTEADSLTLPAAPEKITLDSTGEIWAAGHASLFSWRDFAADAGKRAPSQVFRVSLASGVPQQAEQVYGNDGSEIAGASVAALAGKQLLIGSSLDGSLSCVAMISSAAFCGATISRYQLPSPSRQPSGSSIATAYRTAQRNVGKADLSCDGWG